MGVDHWVFACLRRLANRFVRTVGDVDHQSEPIHVSNYSLAVSIQADPFRDIATGIGKLLFLWLCGVSCAECSPSRLRTRETLRSPSRLNGPSKSRKAATFSDTTMRSTWEALNA